MNTDLPDERVRLLKSIDHIQQLEDESEDIESGDLIKRYTHRPPYLDADWAAWYDNREPSPVRLQKCVKTDSQ